MKGSLTNDKFILGISAYGHDASAALLKNGQIVLTVEEERFNREKHSAAFPIHAIKACLAAENLDIEDIQVIAFYIKPWLELSGNLLHVARYFPASLQLGRAEFGGGAQLRPIDRMLKCLLVRDAFAPHFPGSRIPKVQFVEHHLAHAASAFFLSPFDRAAILTIDARGESTATLISHGIGNQIHKLEDISVPNSLGMFYAAMTWYLGFKPFFDEWKVMGLSAYGQPRFVTELTDVLRFDQEGYSLNLDYFKFHIKGPSEWLSPKFFELFGARRSSEKPITQLHYDFAKSLQTVIENVGVMLAKKAKALTGESNLCLAGGVALNVLMNSRIVAEAGFEQVFIQPVAGDAGTSFGAASFYHHSIQKNARGPRFETPYLGPSHGPEAIVAALEAANVQYEQPEDPIPDVVKALAEGKIVGWYQGSMEAGPRALGNRSILADPRDPKMKDRLNLRIKRRESFRPFAPSVTEEDVHKFFDMPNHCLSPYMVLAGRTRPEFRDQLPAVTHVDGTARVHTVSAKTNLKYWSLLKAFEKKTGFPVLLNTSFNESEPIVESPTQAIECFQRTEMDLLVLGNYIVKKH